MNYLINKRLEKYKHKSREISDIEIDTAKSILFSIFSRYGDTIISLKIINEFIKKYPNKKYVILLPRQQLIYAKEIISFSNVEFIPVNKRNPISFLWAIYYLKKSNIDIGFNPWGHGSDSEYYLTYTKRYYFFKKFDNFKKMDNLYLRIRLYLNIEIPSKIFNIVKPNFKNVNKILIAPISTDIKKNLTVQQTNVLIEKLQKKFLGIEIVVAIPKNLILEKFKAKKFIFTKSNFNSTRYLKLLKSSDIFIGVDSGPLHLALALGIDTIGIFGPTAPNTILDYNAKILILRDKSIKDYFCHVRACKDPLCIDNIVNNSDIFEFDYDIPEKITYDENICQLKV
ncbi:glycosyltransferase family 9 protein [Arcobacter sp.]|uniref:glycosyltransferase family 9 protein n=1 Tax=Arcobacter sp. TaxID=1872629 RepID=UPI003D0B8C46